MLSCFFCKNIFKINSYRLHFYTVHRVKFFIAKIFFIVKYFLFITVLFKIGLDPLLISTLKDEASWEVRFYSEIILAAGSEMF